MNCLFWLFLGISYAEEGSGQSSEGSSAQSPPGLQENTTKFLGENYQANGLANPDELKKNLLAPQPDAPPAEEEKKEASLSLWGVVLALLALMGFGAFIARKRKPSATSMRILSRSYFGRDGSLAVVEMLDGSDNTRRFLIGLNSNGAPRMVADLSPTVSFPEIGDPSSQQRLNILVGDDPIQNGKELLSEVLSERQSAATHTYSREKSSGVSLRSANTGREQSEDGTDPWLKGIEKALGKNG